MARLCVLLLLLALPLRAQEPALWLVAESDSVGVGDTLAVRVMVAAPNQRLTSAGLAVEVEAGTFAPLGGDPFNAGDFLPGPPYENAAVQDGEVLHLGFVAVSGTDDGGQRQSAGGSGELARLRLRALAPTAGTDLRLEGEGPRRAIFTEAAAPGVEQRFALPSHPLRVRVGGTAAVPVPGAQAPVAVPSPPTALPEAEAPALPPPDQTPALPPDNRPPSIAPLPGLRVAVGGQTRGPLLAAYLADAEAGANGLRVVLAGDARVAAHLEQGRLVVEGLAAGPGVVLVQVSDPEGATASAEMAVEVLAAGHGPLLRALPRLALGLGQERALDLFGYVYDPDTPTAALRWSLQSGAGVGAAMQGTLLTLRGEAMGEARVELQVADPEGNSAIAALVVQVGAAPPPLVPVPEVVPQDTLRISAPPAPGDAPAPEEVAVADSATQNAPDPVPVPPQSEALPPLAADSTAATPTSTTATEEPIVETPVPTTEPEAPAAGPVATEPAPADIEQLPTAATPAEAQAPGTGEDTAPFAPLAEVGAAPQDASTAPPAGAAGPDPTQAAPPAGSAPPLALDASASHQILAGRIDSALVADRWVREGAVDQVQWSLRGGKRLVARLEPTTRRLYLDARGAQPGREVFFAEARLGEERRQLTLSVEVRAPRLSLLPLPPLALAAGSEVVLDLGSYVQGDFGPEELAWSLEAPAGALADLDQSERLLRVRESGSFALVLRVRSPWGNQAEVQVEVQGAPLPAPPSAAPTTVVPEAETQAPATAGPPAALPPAPPSPEPEAPADQTPPRLWLAEALGQGGLVLRLGADEALQGLPRVRVNGQVVAVEAHDGGYMAALAPPLAWMQVQAEAEDLAGNRAETSLFLAAHRVGRDTAPVSSADGQWQFAFPRAREGAWVLIRPEGEGQCLAFDPAQTGPVELVARFAGEAAPAILRDQGQGWEVLPTLALPGEAQVFARSEQAGAFKLAGRAAGVLPAEPLVYPNPFNTQAVIRYQVGGEGLVRVQVRDGQGRVVRQLVDQAQRSGVRSVVWDGRDALGRQAASGVYFLEVQAAGRRWTAKLLLLR